MAKADDKQVKYFEDQFDDEEVLFVFRKHPAVMRKGLIIASVGMLLPVLFTAGLTVVFANDPERLPTMEFFFGSLFVGLILSFLLIAPALMAWYFSVFIVTDQRFIQITQKGFFHRSVVDIGLNQIQMVNYEVAGLEQTMLGFGTIMMQTYLGELVIHEIHHPAKIQKKLIRILRDEGIDIVNFPSSDNKKAKVDEEAIE
jgi:hypothetical protein